MSAQRVAAKAVERELRACRRWLMAIANEDGAEDRDQWSDGVYFAAEHVLERIQFHRKRIKRKRTP